MPPTPDKVKIRGAEAANAPTIVEFNRRLALESEAKQLDAAVLTSGVRIALERPELCRYFLAETNGQIVGQTMLTYEWSDWRAGVFWWIQSVYVQAGHRGRGVFATCSSTSPIGQGGTGGLRAATLRRTA